VRGGRLGGAVEQPAATERVFQLALVLVVVAAVAYLSGIARRVTSTALRHPVHPDTHLYNQRQDPPLREVCVLLAETIDRYLPEAEN